MPHKREKRARTAQRKSAQPIFFALFLPVFLSYEA
jgi:hypothetical protein